MIKCVECNKKINEIDEIESCFCKKCYDKEINKKNRFFFYSIAIILFICIGIGLNIYFEQTSMLLFGLGTGILTGLIIASKNNGDLN